MSWNHFYISQSKHHNNTYSQSFKYTKLKCLNNLCMTKHQTNATMFESSFDISDPEMVPNKNNTDITKIELHCKNNKLFLSAAK
nr:hypothetical protein Itr_chr08CG18300 [Ipomoea trifida]